MCIVYLALNSHPDWPLFIAANRDEFHNRPSLFAAPWKKNPDVIAGIDLQAGGTWLGVTRQGRFGFLTNYREMGHTIIDAPSRGELVSDYLSGPASVADYAANLNQKANTYNGFNLVVGDLTAACYISNRTPLPGQRDLDSGRYVISNHLIDTPWPKATRLRQTFEQLDMDSLTHSLKSAFVALKDTTPADDNALPETGLSLERERLLSSPFIISPDYGTRCSTLILIHRSGRALVSETSYDLQGNEVQRHDWPFDITMAHD